MESLEMNSWKERARSLEKELMIEKRKSFSPRKEMRCFNCGKFGHFSYSCNGERKSVVVKGFIKLGVIVRIHPHKIRLNYIPSCETNMTHNCLTADTFTMYHCKRDHNSDNKKDIENSDQGDYTPPKNKF